MTSSRYLRAASGHPAIFFATFAISPFCLEQQEKTPVVSSQMLEGDIKMGGERRGVGYGPGGVVGSNIQSRVVCYGKEFLQLPACVLLTRPHSFPDSALLCTFGRGLQMADSAPALARGAPYRFEEELGRLGRHAGRLCFGFGCGVVTCAFSFLPSFLLSFLFYSGSCICPRLGLYALFICILSLMPRRVFWRRGVIYRKPGPGAAEC